MGSFVSLQRLVPLAVREGYIVDMLFRRLMLCGRLAELFSTYKKVYCLNNFLNFRSLLGVEMV